MQTKHKTAFREKICVREEMAKNEYFLSIRRQTYNLHEKKKKFNENQCNANKIPIPYKDLQTRLSISLFNK